MDWVPPPDDPRTGADNPRTGAIDVPNASCACVFLSFSLLALPAFGDEPAADVLKPPPADTFVILPLRVHILTSSGLKDVDCKLKESDIKRILGKVNGIWNMAGIHWVLESIIREPAARQDQFKELQEDVEQGEARRLAAYRILRPDGTREFDGLHIYYIHKFPFNGIWMGTDFVIVQETASLREVEGGIDEPVPRVTSHELGHALGLPHRQARTNLLASGTTGTILNSKEVETARARAQKLRGRKTVEELKAEAAQAEKDGNTESARRTWTWLSELPGAGDEPRSQLERLKPRAASSP